MSWIDRDERVIWHPYTQAKTAGAALPIVRGEGTLLFDEVGNQYIDAISSWWVTLHGHAHPYLAEKLQAQALELEHVIFAGFTHPRAIELAERLLKHLPSRQARVFFSDNGSTAVEIGLKMAMQYFHNQGKPRKKIIAFSEAFHGETFGAMSASGDHAFNTAFHPFLFPVTRIPAPVPGREAQSLAALEEALADGEAIAFIFEPLVMGAGGMLMYEPAALDAMIAACHRQGTLCIADEVMTGFGRTGKFFASHYLKEQPDILCLAKGLTGGTLPLAITTCTAEIYQAFYADDRLKTFFHGHSFTGNPLGCAVALASLELLEGSVCQERIGAIAARHAQFREEVANHPALVDVRQRGTILALEFKTPEQTGYFNQLRDRLYQFYLKRGVLLRPLGNVIYLLPPYCITDQQLDRIYAVLAESLEVFGVSTPQGSRESTVQHNE
ncbi:MAG: adenosylmethionine--8-amino-7-oxononanoate transaminase [Lewinellaceae bacterium]|nr:adenosylmethionine--8-amino-7-oxononanoate transaminase [Lewinellaceae bacterium]